MKEDCKHPKSELVIRFTDDGPHYFCSECGADGGRIYVPRLTLDESRNPFRPLEPDFEEET